MSDVYMVKKNPSNGDLMVYDFEFFRERGGTTEPWGKQWISIYAKSAEEARLKALQYL